MNKEKILCSNCNHLIERDDIYCENCGIRIDMNNVTKGTSNLNKKRTAFAVLFLCIH